jgi:hypothetical protein
LGEAVYREQQAASSAGAGAPADAGAGQAGPAGQAGHAESSSGKGRDEPVDADFEVKT